MKSMATKPSWKQKIRGHVTGPVGSVLFHVLLITLMIRFLTGQTGLMNEEETIISVIPRDLKTPVLDPVTPIEPEKAKMEDPTVLPVFEDTFSSSSEPEPAPLPGSGGEDSSAPDLEKPDSPIPAITINAPGGGLTPDQRKKLGEIYSTPEAERAVVRALRWLKANQNPDGSWNTTHQVGNTGLGLLTFLAHGKTVESDEYGATVERALHYLLGHVKENGEFDAARGHSYVYEHAIGTYALADSFHMMHVPEIQTRMERAVAVILKGQNTATGGWDYGYNPAASRNDSSVSAWQIQALKAALISGATNPGLLETLQRATAGMRSLQNKGTGEFAYASDSGRSNPGLTALGVLSLQFTGPAGSAEVRRGIAALRGVKATPDLSDWPFYAWYYITQAKFFEKGAVWDDWNRQITPRLVTSQARDGSWASLSNGEKDLGRAYATTLAALTLQVYSRHLSTSGDKALAMPVRRETDLRDPYDWGIRL